MYIDKDVSGLCIAFLDIHGTPRTRGPPESPGKKHAFIGLVDAAMLIFSWKMLSVLLHFIKQNEHGH